MVSAMPLLPSTTTVRALLGQPLWPSLGRRAGATRLDPQGPRHTLVTVLFLPLGISQSWVFLSPSQPTDPSGLNLKEIFNRNHSQMDNVSTWPLPLHLPILRSLFCDFTIPCSPTPSGFSRALLSLHHYSAIYAQGIPLPLPVPQHPPTFPIPPKTYIPMNRQCG